MCTNTYTCTLPHYFVSIDLILSHIFCPGVNSNSRSLGENEEYRNNKYKKLAYLILTMLLSIWKQNVNSNFIEYYRKNKLVTFPSSKIDPHGFYFYSAFHHNFKPPTTIQSNNLCFFL